jgi:hypothetical protein
MKQVWKDSYSRLTKILFMYDIVLFVYIILSGQIMGELYYTNVLLIVSYFIIMTSFISALFCFIHSIACKEYSVIWQSVKMIISGILLYAMIVALALTAIY